MRQADIDRDWRRANEQSTLIREFSYAKVDGLNDASLQFDCFANAFIGANGAGKSTLLALLRIALDAEYMAPPLELVSRLEGATIQVSLSAGEGGEKASFMASVVEGVVTRTTAGHGALPPCTYLDIAHDARMLKSMFSDNALAGELLESIEPRSLGDREVAIVSWLTGKNYHQVEISEIPIARLGESAASTDETVLYPVVSEVRGAKYGPVSMGLGELCTILLYEKLNRLAAGSVVLLDEPETSLSRESEKRIGNFIAHVGLQRSASFFLSTHSELIVSRLPSKGLVLCYRAGGATSVQKAPTEGQMFKALGAPTRPKKALICEDSVGACLLEALLRNRCPELVGDWYTVKVRDGESSVTRASQTIPELSGFEIIAIYDADQRAKIRTAEACQRLTLPGRTSPEAWIREQIEKYSPKVARSLGISRVNLTITLSQLEGDDEHEWLRHLVERSTGSLDVLLDKLILSLPMTETKQFSDLMLMVFRSKHIVARAERLLSLAKKDRDPLDQAEMKLLRAVADRKTQVIWSKDIVRRAKTVIKGFELERPQRPRAATAKPQR